VTVTNPSWGGPLGTGATVNAGFQAGFTGSPGTPSGFTLNGTPCNLQR
jgi:Cellulose binding domain